MSLRAACLVAVAALLVHPGRAAAVCPVAALSSVPHSITLVGHDGISADPLGTFTIFVAGPAGPCPGAVVTLDFSGSPDIGVCSAQLDPGLAVACAGKLVVGTTNASGMLTTSIIGSATGGSPVASPPGSLKIFADGVLLGGATVHAYDMDGSLGLGANDLSLWLSDFGSGTSPLRIDYDGSGSVGANDLSLWLGAFGAGGSALSCGGATCY